MCFLYVYYDFVLNDSVCCICITVSWLSLLCLYYSFMFNDCVCCVCITASCLMIVFVVFVLLFHVCVCCVFITIPCLMIVFVVFVLQFLACWLCMYYNSMFDCVYVILIVWRTYLLSWKHDIPLISLAARSSVNGWPVVWWQLKLIRISGLFNHFSKK